MITITLTPKQVRRLRMVVDQAIFAACEHRDKLQKEGKDKAVTISSDIVDELLDIMDILLDIMDILDAANIEATE